MNFKKIKLPEISIRATAGVLCLIMILCYFSADLLAKYTSSGNGSDNASVASLGEVSISGGGAFTANSGITPGVDIPISLSVTKTSQEYDVPSWVILAFDLSVWSFDSANNRLYLGQNMLEYRHEVNTNSQLLYFDIDQTMVPYSYYWVNAGSYGNYAFFAQRVESGSTGSINQPNIIKNNKLYVSAEINTDDIIAINTYADSITVKPYLVSQYGFSSNTAVSELCKHLYNEVISKE